MHEHADLLDQVREILATTFGVDGNEVPDDISQNTYSRWTSLSHMTLLLALEEHFGVIFTMDEMSEMTSLGRIITVLNKHGAR